MLDTPDQKILLNLLRGTAEAMGSELRPDALTLMTDDLKSYPLFRIKAALSRCRHEMSGQLSLARIMERLEKNDGRPDPHEAWSIALKARDENETVVWCQEIAASWWLAESVLRMGDMTGAREAFNEIYSNLVADARMSGQPVKWTVSAGHDLHLRELAVESAHAKGLLTDSQRLVFLAPKHHSAVTSIVPTRIEKPLLPDAVHCLKALLPACNDASWDGPGHSQSGPAA